MSETADLSVFHAGETFDLYKKAAAMAEFFRFLIISSEWTGPRKPNRGRRSILLFLHSRKEQSGVRKEPGYGGSGCLESRSKDG